MAYAFGVDGDRLVVVGEGYFDLYDIGDPEEIVFVENWITSYTAGSIVIDGDEFVLGCDGFLLTGDLSTPGALNVHTSVGMPGPAAP